MPATVVITGFVCGTTRDTVIGVDTTHCCCAGTVLLTTVSLVGLDDGCAILGGSCFTGVVVSEIFVVSGGGNCLVTVTVGC